MLRTYLVLLSCQAVGETIHQLVGLPLSGPIIGMVLLLVVLTVSGGVPFLPDHQLIAVNASRVELVYVALFGSPDRHYRRVD